MRRRLLFWLAAGFLALTCAIGSFTASQTATTPVYQLAGPGSAGGNGG